MGGLSIFLSFACGAVVLISASRTSGVIAAVYVVVSFVLGYVAGVGGLKFGGQRPG
jgi:CrcB protein